MTERTKCENAVTFPACVWSAFWLLSCCAVLLRNQLSRGGVCTHPSRRWWIWQGQLEGQLGKGRRSSRLERECMKPAVSSSESKPGSKVSLWGKKLLYFFFLFFLFFLLFSFSPSSPLFSPFSFFFFFFLFLFFFFFLFPDSGLSYTWIKPTATLLGKVPCVNWTSLAT